VEAETGQSGAGSGPPSIPLKLPNFTCSETKHVGRAQRRGWLFSTFHSFPSVAAAASPRPPGARIDAPPRLAPSTEGGLGEAP
jgi:hypothetical protein